jgi:hypothetical protein
MRETAEYSLKSILRDEIADSLRVRVERFEATTGRRPAALRELVEARLLGSVPDGPFGGTYFIDQASGTVLSTTAVSAAAERSRAYLERLLGRYQDRYGRFPYELEDLVHSGLVDELPRVAGADITYDSESGTVGYILRSGGER